MEGMTERPRARPDLTVVELDGEAVIYDEISGDLHRLNPTATIVFSFLDGSATLEELAGDLAGAYGSARGGDHGPGARARGPAGRLPSADRDGAGPRRDGGRR